MITFHLLKMEVYDTSECTLCTQVPRYPLDDWFCNLWTGLFVRELCKLESSLFQFLLKFILFLPFVDFSCDAWKYSSRNRISSIFHLQPSLCSQFSDLCEIFYYDATLWVHCKYHKEFSKVKIRQWFLEDPFYNFPRWHQTMFHEDNTLVKCKLQNLHFYN